VMTGSTGSGDSLQLRWVLPSTRISCISALLTQKFSPSIGRARDQLNALSLNRLFCF
jgi:hypothetical protein